VDAQDGIESKAAEDSSPTVNHTRFDPVTRNTSPAVEKRSPQTAIELYKQEIRFAVVLYGGVSLAIYIHGVAQELLRLVRATSGADLTEDKVAQLYSEISREVRHQNDSRNSCPTRFVIDILSGTSAGGINAIFLAKAIAIRSENLNLLRQTWLNVADMGQLLNTGGQFQPKRSLLKGAWMYEQLHQAFDRMSKEKLDPVTCYRPEKLDLFVTTTDLNGATVPIRLADMDVREKVHKGSFNFRFDHITLDSSNELDQLLSNSALARDDLRDYFDPMLAFAARCTSSFPVAFAPMKLIDIQSAIGEKTYKDRKEDYLAFFRWVPPDTVFEQECKDLDRRELADGGYLDNKPFGFAIDAMTFRTSRLPHQRKLIFVDPFPEVAANDICHEHFDFIENGLAAASILPRYQTIREEIARVEFSNRTQSRLGQLREIVHETVLPQQRFDFNDMFAKDPSKPFEEKQLTELTKDFGAEYATYHEVRRLDVSDDLARIVSSTQDTAESQDFFLAIRYLVRAWREKNYAPNKDEHKKLETEFFTEFDYSFRLRRAAHLLEKAQTYFPGACDSLIQQITRLLRMRDLLSLPNASLNPVWKDIESANDQLSWENLKTILEPTPDGDRLESARALYREHKRAFDGIADAIRTQWGFVFERNRTLMAKLLEEFPGLSDGYKLFDYDDMISLAFLEGSNVSEHTQTEVYRVSPVDGLKVGASLGDKLAGYKVGNFGAFLKKEWRENDMLWGRLDACERIVSAVLNHPDDHDKKDCFVKRLQMAIIEQEEDRCTLDLSPMLEAAKQCKLADYAGSKYKLPDAPTRADSAQRIAKAADILGRMLEEDVGVKNSTTSMLRSVASIAVTGVAFLSPGSLKRVFLNYCLELIALAGFLLYVLGGFGKMPQARSEGEIIMAGVVVLAFLVFLFGFYLANKLPAFAVRFLKWIPGLVLAVLVVIGCRHFPEDAGRFLDQHPLLRSWVHELVSLCRGSSRHS
jgi:patatin-related protein